MYERPPCTDPVNCALKAPLGPPENKCTCTPHVNNLLNQSEYEVGKEKSKKKYKQLKLVKDTKGKNSKYNSEFEFADDAISLNSLEDRPPSRASLKSSNTSLERSTTENPYVTVNGKEELPSVQEMGISDTDNNKAHCNLEKDIVNNFVPSKKVELHTPNKKPSNNNKNLDGNYNKLTVKNIYSYCTLPKSMKKLGGKGQQHKGPPKKVTPDGTSIYYWCDLNKKHLNGKVFTFFTQLLTHISRVIN